MSIHGENAHLVTHINNPGLIHDNTLHVVTCVSNPVRYHSRYRLARQFIEAMKQTKNVQLTVVETAYGDRYHEVTSDPKSEFDVLQLRNQSEAWIKESMLNLGMRQVITKYNPKYLGWFDADIFFADNSWAQECLHQLQHFEVVQPWSDCIDMGPLGNVFQHFRSFGYQHQRRLPKQKHPGQKYYQYAHSGFAWACTRRFWENVGGLIDFAPLGSADHHMAFGMIGEINDTIHRGMSPNFFRKCNEWQAKAVRITNNEVGFVPTTIEHKFHGPKKRRYYRERWEILVDHGFDPDKDLMYDSQGLRILVGKPKLEHAIKLYNRSRFEDSIEQD